MKAFMVILWFVAVAYEARDKLARAREWLSRDAREDVP